MVTVLVMVVLIVVAALVVVLVTVVVMFVVAVVVSVVAIVVMMVVVSVVVRIVVMVVMVLVRYCVFFGGGGVRVNVDVEVQGRVLLAPRAARVVHANCDRQNVAFGTIIYRSFFSWWGV